jgi:hypothetical protein
LFLLFQYQQPAPQITNYDRSLFSPEKHYLAALVSNCHASLDVCFLPSIVSTMSAAILLLCTENFFHGGPAAIYTASAIWAFSACIIPNIFSHQVGGHFVQHPPRGLSPQTVSTL